MKTPNETMTLIERFLDGTITQAEKEALETQMHSSPELAEEVSELVKIESLLSSQAEAERVAAPADFLRGVENVVAAKMAESAAPSVSNGISGTFWLVVAGLVTVAGITLYSVLKPFGYSEPAPSAQAPVPEQQAPVIPEPASPQPAISEERSSESMNAPENTVAPKNSEEITAPAEEAPAQKSKEALSATNDDRAIADNRDRQLQAMKDQLAQVRRSGDKTAESLILKQLGMMTRQFKRYDESAAYFEQALTAAQASKLPPPEIININMEAGNLEKMRNNKEKAAQHYRKAMSMLESIGANTDELRRKIQELEK